ncbi:MAG: hypothetical protein HAW67_06065 [Endozoicomonadaceae bacterium]|nr:hypothetical protein [Endozoicomonadaceae bacterium]
MSQCNHKDEYTFFVAKSDFATGRYLLKYSLTAAQTFGRKCKPLIRKVQPLTCEYSSSNTFALEYAEEFAKSHPDNVVTCDLVVVGACDMVLDFGKFKGRKLDEVKVINPAYIRWLAENVMPKNINMQKIIKQCKIWTYRLGLCRQVG